MAIGDKKIYNSDDTIILRPKPDLPQADDSLKKEYKGKWNWMIAVQPVKVFDPPGAGKRKEHPIRGIYYDEDPTAQPILVAGKPYPFLIECTTGMREQEFELIDQLTSDRGNIHKQPTDARLYKYLKHEPDGLYRLVFYKQSMGSQYMGKNVFAFWGWNLISKNRDLILMETRYIQCGTLDRYNLDTRDPREDARRKHYHEIPSGGIDYVW